MENSRRVRDIVSIKRTIWSNYDKFRTLGVFYLERNSVFNAICALPDDEISAIAQECREGGVRWRSFLKHLNKVETSLIGGREIIDCSLNDECAFECVHGMAVEDFIRVREKNDGVSVSFNLSGTFDVLSKSNRNGCFEANGITISPESEFRLVNELTPYWEDRYSLALKSDSFSVAVSAEDPKTGKKGSACAKLYVIENGTVRIDDLGKYTDTTALTLWINP